MDGSLELFQVSVKAALIRKSVAGVRNFRPNVLNVIMEDEIQRACGGIFGDHIMNKLLDSVESHNVTFPKQIMLK